VGIEAAELFGECRLWKQTGSEPPGYRGSVRSSNLPLSSNEIAIMFVMSALSNGMTSDFHSDSPGSIPGADTSGWRHRAAKLGFIAAEPRLKETRERQRNEAMALFVAANKHCKACGKQISYEQRRATFCSRSCSIGFNTSLRAFGVCKRCGGARSSPGRRPVGKRYCLACSTTMRSRTLVDLKTDASRKAFLVRRHGRKCMMCSTTTWNGMPVPIELDHIDGDSDNNSEENLRLLCPNCHAQTPTYKAKNKANGSSRGRRRREWKRSLNHVPFV
jgi:HNH endonuclease